MLLATALLIVGLLLVVYSADRLVFAASILCRTFGIPPLIIGILVHRYQKSSSRLPRLCTNNAI